MKRIKLIMALCLTLSMGTAVAFDHEVPEEGERFCTIGWYKNHGFDSWYPQCVSIDGASYCDSLVDELYSTGAKAGIKKNAAADLIVENYVGFGNESCEEASE